MHEVNEQQLGTEDIKFIFSVFNEIGIINQLTRTLFEQVLPDRITVPHFSVLNHLVRLGDGQTPLHLATAFQVPKASMTNTLQGLEQRGLIRLAPNPKDGRGKLVYLTERGRQFREQAIQLLAPHMQVLSERFDVTTLEPVLPVLQNLRQILDEYRD